MSPPGAVSFQRFLVRTAGLKRHYYDVSCTLPSYGFESVWSNGLCPLEEFCKEEYVNYQENVLPFPQNCNAPQNTTWILTIGMNSLFDLYHFSLLFLHDYANFTFINTGGGGGGYGGGQGGGYEDRGGGYDNRY